MVCLKFLKPAKSSPMSSLQAGMDFPAAPLDKQVEWTEQKLTEELAMKTN